MKASRPSLIALQLLPAIVLTFFIIDIFTSRFTDRFLSGTGFGVVGLDFFSVPRSFINLLQGASIFDSDHAAWYGSHASPYYYHPFISVAVGSWTSALPPNRALLAFILVSASLLLYTGSVWRKYFTTPLYRAAAMALVCCSLPVYLMLWHEQMHIFTVVSVVLILSAIIDIKAGKKAGKKLIAGLLLSLLSKPLIVLWLPALLIVKETRKATLRAMGIYVLVSILFLLVPFLNPQGDNQIHWSNIVAHTTQSDVHRNIYSFINIMSRYNHSRWVNVACLVIPAVLVLSSLLLPRIQDLKRKMDAMLVLMLGLLCAYYFAYTIVWEYHYTTLMASMPAILYLVLQSEGRDRVYLKGIFIAGLALYLPTTYFLISQPNAILTVVMQLCKVVPVTLMMLDFILLLIRIFKRSFK